jgi:hypothetical protein
MGSVTGSPAGSWLNNMFPLVARKSILSKANALDFNIIPLTNLTPEFPLDPWCTPCKQFRVRIKSESGIILVSLIRAKLRPVRANRRFPHPLPSHICFHQAPGQQKLHGCEKKQGCHLPASYYMRKQGTGQAAITVNTITTGCYKRPVLSFEQTKGNIWKDISMFHQKNRNTTFVKTSLNSRSSLYVCCSLSLLAFISSRSCSCSANFAWRSNKASFSFAQTNYLFSLKTATLTKKYIVVKENFC